MSRVHVICEGQTEETFVNEVLAPHLGRFDVYPAAALVGKPGRKGGAVTTARMLGDISLRLMSDSEAHCTTFFDFYGLDSNFAGKEAALALNDFCRKAELVEQALTEKVLEKVGQNTHRRFIPYIQMYEFEGLLFSDPAKLASGIGEPELAISFSAIRTEFTTPEEINDSRITAPSKRILQLMPRYEKPLFGSLAALEIGLDTIRRECRRFDGWITRLEELNVPTIQG